KHADAHALMGLMEAGSFSLSKDFVTLNRMLKANQWPDRFDLEAVVDRMYVKIPTWREELRSAFLAAAADAPDKNPDALNALRRYCDMAPFRALFLESSPESQHSGLTMAKVRDGLIFETTRIGNIALGFGVSLETVKILARWVDEWCDGKTAWSLFDLLALVKQTPDGENTDSLRVFNETYGEIKTRYEETLANLTNIMPVDWWDRSPISTLNPTVPLQATFLAIERWCAGHRLYKGVVRQDEAPDIETSLGLTPYGSSVRERARDFSRLLRVVEALVRALLKSKVGEMDESEPLASWGSEFILPRDMSALVDCVATGMPPGAVELGRLGLKGLSRSWALDLFEKMEETSFEEDLPVIERLRLFSQEPTFYTHLPTPGLGQRIQRELETKPRSPVAEALRHEPSRIAGFFSNEAVRHAQILQGIGRYTALRVCHRSAYTVIRRNEAKAKPIEIEKHSHFDGWVRRGAVEFLAEVGFQTNSGGYRVDRFLADLDPRNGFPLESLKKLALEIGNRFGAHNFVEHVYYHWTGGRGFHVIGEFMENILQKPEQVKRIIEGMTNRLSDDVAIFNEDQPHLAEPFVVIDLKPMMRRGIYRNGLSLHANAGGVSIPLTGRALTGFNPEDHATIDAVLALLNPARSDILLQCDTYPEFVGSVSGFIVEDMAAQSAAIEPPP
ncbi:MAG: hypothetical protein QGG64_05545, partial [Candidatus Latescibacteria bacterium]|nr:hypothetical protein [Candidatus Latescibacterota bacterium]